IAELCFPALAILGLQAFFKSSKEVQLKGLKNTSVVFGALLVLLFVMKSIMDFEGANDAYYMQIFQDGGHAFLKALIDDRKAMYTADLFRTFCFIALAAGVLFAYYKDKLSIKYAVIGVGLLGVIDL